MPRGKYFGIIAAVSTVLLTAGFASAHGRVTTARIQSARATAAVHKTHHMKAVHAHLAAVAAPSSATVDPVVTPPVVTPPVVTPCVETDDTESGDSTSGDSEDSGDVTTPGVETDCDDQQGQSGQDDQGQSGQDDQGNQNDQGSTGSSDD